MVAKKRKSKRQTLQQKFKIIKRTKEHHKKLKSGKLSNPNHSLQKKAANKVENRIPNAWPYKEDLLKQIESAKERMEEAKLRQKEKRKEEINKRRKIESNEEEEEEEYEDVDDMDEEEVPDLVDNSKQKAKYESVLRNAAETSGKEFEEEEEDNTPNDPRNANSSAQNSRRAYLRELRKVIESSDVIIHVLDARDPRGTKSSNVEDMVLSNYRKKIIYLLNKADLVPKEVLEGWLKYFRQFHPTVPFKCNTQQQKGNFKISSSVSFKSNNAKDLVYTSSQAIGTEELLNILKNYARVSNGNNSNKTIITVGIVGFPNVGKSSLINSLMRSRAVGVSAVPGFTKSLQEVILDKNIRLIDSPGVVFEESSASTNKNIHTLLRNCVNIEEMNDVITPIQIILSKCPPEYLMQVYSIPKFTPKDVMGFLALVAKSLGKLKKGGVPNIDATARTLLHDWNQGKIKYYCIPPKVSEVNQQDRQTFKSEFQLITSTSATANSEEGIDVNTLNDLDVKVLNDLYPAADNKSKKSDENYFFGLDTIGDDIDIDMKK